MGEVGGCLPGVHGLWTRRGVGTGGGGGYVARSIESQIALHANRLPHALHYWSGSRDDGRTGGGGEGGEQSTTQRR